MADSIGATTDEFAGDDGNAKDHKWDPTHKNSNIRMPLTKVYYDPTKIGACEVFEHYLQYKPTLRLAPPTADPGIELGPKQTRRALLSLLLTLAFTIPVLVFAWTTINHARKAYLHPSLVLATLVQVVALVEFVSSAW